MVAELINDRYETLEQLGGGGQGRVYLALDHQHGRKVALKVRDLIGDDAREALLREARMLLRLEPHRGLPTVRDDFFVGDHYYLVMDWIEGTNLQRVLVNRGDPGLPPDTVIGYLEQAADALDHIHQHDPAVVHGDVKPDNLILGPKGRVFVVDFGVAVNRGAEASAGTQGYIAPEVGAGAPQTPASDIYALAATAFALLSGSPPEGDAPTWSGIRRVQAGNLEHALRLALSTDPNRRPGTCKELVDRLRGWLEPEGPDLGASRSQHSVSTELFAGATSADPAGQGAEGLPGIVVTFLLTDIEGSTRLWEDRSDRAGAAVDRHEELIRASVSRHHGVHLKRRGEGDSTFNVFTSAFDAVAAALDLQRSITAELWPEGVELRVRAALHTGEAELHGGDYLGTAVNRCARLRSTAHGGQVVLSAATAELTRDCLPEGAGLRSLGAHRLKDLARPETVFQLEHADLPTNFPALRSLEPALHNLPAQRTTLIGRAGSLERICVLLDESRLLTLTGVGGCGKTRLAIAATTEILPHYKDGVLFVDLAAISDPSLVWTALASSVVAVTGAFGGSPRPLRDDLLDFLQDSRTLVLMDNCEHLADACAEMADAVLVRCPSVTILATSREALGIEGEQTFVVPSLELPGDENPGVSASVELFVARATAARPDFELTVENLPSVVEICRRLDGIPLAIELAAALVTHLSAGQIYDRLHERFKLLTGTRRRVQRQQTLQATMDWSYQLLPEAERTLLRRLAVFPGSFDLAAVEAICGMGSDTVALVGSLVARSLVGLREESSLVRYRLLETVRLYAEAQLAQAGESDAYRTRHRDHYLSVVNATPIEDALWNRNLASFVVEIDNLTGALDWSAGEGRFDHIVRILLRAGDSWNWTGAHEETKRWLDIATHHKAELGPEGRLELLAAADLAALASTKVDAFTPWARAEVWGTGGLADRYILIGLYVEGIFSTVLNAEEAVRIADDGFRLAESGQPRIWSGLMRILRGEALAVLGDLNGSVEAYRDAERRTEPREWPRFWATWAQTIPLHMLGEHELALQAATRAGDLEARYVDINDEVFNGCMLAIATAAKGDPDPAENIVAGLVERVRRTNVPGIFELCIGTFAWVAAIRSDFERASRLLGASGPIYRSPSLFALYQHYIRIVRNALDADTARRCRAEGSAMSRDEAIAEALRHAVRT